MPAPREQETTMEPSIAGVGLKCLASLFLFLSAAETRLELALVEPTLRPCPARIALRWKDAAHLFQRFAHLG
ncbi:hypothetical protein HRbin30_01837 [bacterium HR30]|nr:hypothetical protein HRbin30_01837 [bacterium HR30]